MLPTNVMHFMKKMVTTTESDSSGSATGGGGGDTTGTTLSKLRQTLSSGLMSAQETVTKLSPTRQPMAPDAAAVAALAMAAPTLNSTTALQDPTKTESTKNQQNKMEQLGRPRSGACRVCLKSFKTDDFFRICCECTQKVCEDCASYSKNEEGLEESQWRCSICRRRSQNRGQTQRTASASGALGLRSDNSAGDMLELPGGLQRRHSDVKLGAGAQNAAATNNNVKVLELPRSPELRRHSDVSPASLRELEKVAGERREELRWEREMEWRAEQQQGRLKQRRGGAATKFIVGDDPKSSESSLEDDTMTEEEAEWRRQQAQRGRGDGGAGKGGGFGGQSPRRRSRVMQRQHSYDDEDQTLSAQPQFELSRRASAYDVYQTAGMAKMMDSNDAGGGRRPSFRVPTNGTADAGKGGYDSSASDGRRFQQEELAGGLMAVDDDARRGRRRSSAIEGMRALPATPASGDRRVSAVPSRIMIGGGGGGGGQEVDSGEPMRRQASVTAGEDIKIVIHDVDSEAAAMSRPGTKRRVVLRRDPSDKAHRTRGFGFRVVGGKTGPDGRLFAYIVWTVPQGPADQAGLVQGDRVLEWNGVSLIDKSFEEVCAVMDRAGDAAELVIEHFPDMRMTDLLDDISMAAAAAAGPRKSASDVMGLQLDNDQDKGPASPTRRKLPKTPEQLAREKTVSGRIQIHVWYVEEKKELVVSVLAADDLAPRDDTGYGSQPEAYVKLQVTNLSEPKTFKTDVAEPTHNPIWNATFEIPNVPAESLMKMNIDISLWDYCPDRDSQFLGECTVELQKAFLEDRPNWYRLEDPRQLRFKSPHVSPRGSLANPGTAAREIAQRLLRRGDFAQQRSYSDDKDDETGGNVSHSSSMESGLLHPDHAYIGGSRRGSSQSETLEVDTYQLGRDFSRSLPGSRRSSFQNAAAEKEELGVGYSRERRRSSSSRGGAVMGHYEQREELMIGGAAAKPGAESSSAGLSRTLSLSQDKKPARRPSRYAHDILTGAAAVLSRLDQPERRKSYRRKSSVGPRDFEGNIEGDTIILGPGQIRPRGFRIAQMAGLAAGGYGEIKIALLMTKGQLELEIVCGKGLNAISRGDCPPDTYVKSYLKDGDRWLQKRKTRVCRASYDPVYNQKLRYNACDVLGRMLIIMLWERLKGFESNQGLGGAEIALDKLQLTQPTNAWYPIFPMNPLNGLDEPLDSP